MARSKDSIPQPHAEHDAGFAALEAKVEEIQAEEAAHPHVAGAIEQQQRSFAPLSGAGLASSTRLQKLVEDTAAYGQSAWRLQLDALASLATARGPQDVLKVQIDYGSKAAQAYMRHLRHASELLLGGMGPGR